METVTVCGRQSWRLAADRVELFVTEIGGHMAPVNFKLGARTVQPFLIAPWVEEVVASDTEEVLKGLRGDFFCMPFGDRYMPDDGNVYPLHGESATRVWKLDGIEQTADRSELRASMEWSVRPGSVTKSVTVVEGQPAVYTRHIVSGVTGAFSYGMHPTLQLPDREGCALVSVSPFELGEVCPYPFENPELGGYQALKVGAIFNNLSLVPRMDGTQADLTRYPSRKGYEDFVMMRTRQDLAFGWAAVSVPSEGYVWVSLKDPKVLPVSLMWMSNAGRHYAPWNGRNVGVIGMEEAAVQLPLGPAETALQVFSECPTLNDAKPLTVSTIMAMAATPEGFDRVADIRRIPGGVKVVSSSGKAIEVPLELDFLTKRAG